MGSENHVRCYKHEENEETSGSSLWELFITIRPVFQRAFQKNSAKSSAHHTKHEDSHIRRGIKKMFSCLPENSTDQTLLNDSQLFRSLCSLLEILERLASTRIAQGHTVQRSDCTSIVEQNESQELHLGFVNLMVMKDKLNKVNFGLRQSVTISKKQDSLITELSRPINFFDLCKSDLDQCTLNIHEIWSRYSELCDQTIQSLQERPGNTEYLKVDEIEFIKQANDINDLARKLYSVLAQSLLCKEARPAQLHLSGFLSPNANDSFEVYISTVCGVTDLDSAAYRWINISLENAGNYQAEQLPCAQHQVLATSGFDDIGIEQEATYDNKSQDDEIFDAPLGPTLRELTLRLGFHRNPQYPGLEPHHKAELQFLIACSLLNLDGSHWIQSGLHGNTISLCAAQRTSDFLEFWQPYTTCILSAQTTEEDENLAILSFGILLVETEAGEIASQIERGGNHNHNAEALRCILERTLREGAKGVGLSYKNIAGACLHFATHFETFYDPLIDGSDRRTKRSGAIYKYIVAPLFRLCTQRFQNVDISQPRTIGFPLSAKRYSVLKSESSPRRPAPNAAFFDGSGLASSTRQDRDADTFMNKLKASADYIRKVTTKFSSSNESYQWRSQKIRIAILDTGIDLEDDSFIKGAEDRIKERCSFMNDLNPSLNPLDCQDVHGHGTHVAKLILTAAPSADIFIAKISNGVVINPQHLHRVATAITWAIDEKVDIITMSCGIDAPDEAIDKAIERAVENKISIFAATSNSGGNKTRVYPSSRRDGVIGIHASDGLGNDGGISPTPLEDRDNFSTLGIGIQSRWKKQSIRISGTSYATPIAAALAANMLELARCKCDLTEHQQRMLRKYNGVCRILQLLVGKGKKPRGGYDYIVPEISEELEERFIESLTKIAEEG